MKKYLGLFIFLIFLNSCSGTTTSRMKGNKIYIGMDKKQFCYLFNSFKFKQDPCAIGRNNIHMYFPSTKTEIFADDNREVFFVFLNVFRPWKRKTLGIDEGDGWLGKIFYNYNEAYDYANTHLKQKKIKKSEKKKQSNSTTNSDTRVSIMELLIQDYKTGKIDRDEFERRKKILLK